MRGNAWDRLRWRGWWYIMQGQVTGLSAMMTENSEANGDERVVVHELQVQNAS